MKKKLLEIYGIGEVLADKLDKLITNIEDLHKPEIYELLPTATKLYLKYKPAVHIPRAFIANTVKIIEKAGGIVAGSWRRGVSYCNDIDVLIPKREVYDILAKKLKMLKEPVAGGEEIIRNFIKIKNTWMFIDFFIYKDLAPYLLYATGSKQFNKSMRGIAKNKGYLLNQHGLFKGEKKIICKTEEEIFAHLNMDYLEPYARNL